MRIFKPILVALVAIITAGAGTVQILGFFGVRGAKDLNMPPVIPHWSSLVIGVLLFLFSAAVSGYYLWQTLITNKSLRKEITTRKNDSDKWSTECKRAASEHQQAMDEVRSRHELDIAELVKHTTQEKNKAIDELNTKHADEIAELNKKSEQHALELVKQSATPTRQEQSGSLFPALSALHDQKPQPTFNAKEYFRTAYFSPVTAEIEQSMKIVAHEYDPNNPEVFYTRLIGVGAAACHYDLTWAIIFKSQLDLLAELNRAAKRVSISVARKFYDGAAEKYPNIYPKYGFDHWLGYLQSQSLLVRYPSETPDIPDTIEITHAGRDFLKFLAHWGRDVSTKEA